MEMEEPRVVPELRSRPIILPRRICNTILASLCEMMFVNAPREIQTWTKLDF